VDPLVASGRAADARSMLVAVLADGEELDPELELLLFGQLGIVRALDGAGEPEEIARLRSAMSEGDGSTPARRYAAGALALVEVLRDGTADVAVALARRALPGEAYVDADARSGRPLHVARAALALAGEPQEALRGLERALDVSSARGSIMGQGIGLGWRADPVPRRQRHGGRERRACVARDPVRNGPTRARARGRRRGCVGIDRAWRAG
jgi:hypothetical protein